MTTGAVNGHVCCPGHYGGNYPPGVPYNGYAPGMAPMINNNYYYNVPLSPMEQLQGENYRLHEKHHGLVKGGISGAAAGAAIGALGFLAGPVVGVITTVLGAILGGLFGAKGGEKVADYEAIHRDAGDDGKINGSLMYGTGPLGLNGAF